MWIKLLQAHPVFYPSRSESVGSVHSIGDPKGRALVAAGVAEKSEPLDPEQDDIERVRQKARDRQGGRPLWDNPKNKLQAKRRDRGAAVAALLKADRGRRSTLRRKSALPTRL
jgi:hypothetical protein